MGERILGLRYCDLLVSMKRSCPTCALLVLAILEFSKSLLEIDPDFPKMLQSSIIQIVLRNGSTTVVQVAEEEEFHNEDEDQYVPYFELELYKEAGKR